MTPPNHIVIPRSAFSREPAALASLRGALATKQSRGSVRLALDCFAQRPARCAVRWLAMTPPVIPGRERECASEPGISTQIAVVGTKRRSKETLR